MRPNLLEMSEVHPSAWLLKQGLGNDDTIKHSNMEMKNYSHLRDGVP